MTDSTTKKPAELESLRADIDRSDEAIVGALRTRLGAVSLSSRPNVVTTRLSAFL